MDLGIKELGITLMVGVLTLLGAEIIAHYVINRPFTTFFKDLFGADKSSAAGNKNDKEATAIVTLFVVIVFAVGLIVEAISFKYVDDEKLWIKRLPALVMGEGLTHWLGMPSKDDDRVAVLIESLDNPKPSALAIDLAWSDAFLISDNSKTGLKVQNWIKSKNRCVPGTEISDCPSRYEVEASIASLYYYAKNMAYSDQQHYHELSQIQARLEFARSLAVIGFLYLVVVISVQGFRTRRKRDSAKAGTQVKTSRFAVPLVVAGFLCAYVFGLWAYGRETEAFNRRAFGYLSSNLVYEKRQAEAAAKQQQRSQGNSPDSIHADTK